MNTALKLLVIFFALAALAFVSFFLFIIFALAGSEFYMILLGITDLLLLLLVPLTVFKTFTSRTIKIVWLSLLAGIILASVTRECIRSYHEGFEQLDEVRVDLNAYLPFAEGSRAAGLDSESTLRLRDSLPRMDGATALYPIYAAFAQAVYPEKEYPVYDSEVVCRTTAGAYDALIDGEADIIFVLHPSREQLEYASQQKVEMVLTPIGREAFVFFVNAHNPVSGLTSEELRKIYSGRVKNWKTLGGANRRIRAFQRETGSGSQTAFLKFMEGSEIMPPPRRNVVHGMGGIISRTASYANYPNAIGYTFRFYAGSMVGNDGIKLLSVDGVAPGMETIRNGEYPLTAEFYAVTRADETNPNVRRLVGWILSEQGQSLIEKTGYNPLE